jgi:predicted nucleic acid-binding protein
MSSSYVDANVILRFLTGDPPDMAQDAASLFQAVEDGHLTLIVDDVVIAEVVWVLQSFYHHPTSDIATALRDFLSQDGIQAEEKITLIRALTLYETKNIDFADALVATRMQEQGIEHVFSFDKHFDRIPGILRMIPGEFTGPAGKA